MLSKNKILVDTVAYGLKTELGSLTIVCKLNSSNIFFFIFALFPSPFKNPSGSIIPAFPLENYFE